MKKNHRQKREQNKRDNIAGEKKSFNHQEMSERQEETRREDGGEKRAAKKGKYQTVVSSQVEFYL